MEEKVRGVQHYPLILLNNYTPLLGIMIMRKIEEERIENFIEEVKKIKTFPQNVCFLTYCMLQDRLYFRLEGPKVKSQPLVTYYFATGKRETIEGKEWEDFPLENYVNDLKKYLEKYGLKVCVRKIPYDLKIEHKKRLTNEQIESIFNLAYEMSKDKF